jgi:hypothetical protein
MVGKAKWLLIAAALVSAAPWAADQRGAQTQ